MAAVHNFRSALNGFNREDVVHYIEFINNRNKTQLDQMQTQLRTAQNREQELLARIDAEQARVRELESFGQENERLRQLLEFKDSSYEQNMIGCEVIANVSAEVVKFFDMNE